MIRIISCDYKIILNITINYFSISDGAVNYNRSSSSCEKRAAKQGEPVKKTRRC
jgi:hypothetical protein